MQSNCRKAVGGEVRNTARCPGAQANGPTHGAPACMPARGGQDTQASSLTTCRSASSKLLCSAPLTPAPTRPAGTAVNRPLPHGYLRRLHCRPGDAFPWPPPCICLSQLLCLSSRGPRAPGVAAKGGEPWIRTPARLDFTAGGEAAVAPGAHPELAEGGRVPASAGL